MRTTIALFAAAILTIFPISQASAMTVEQRAANSPAAKALKGYKPSIYRGIWYSPRHEPYRECVMYRESRHNYRAANRTSSARGAYQFLDRSWRISLTHMMIAESRKTSDGLIKEARELRSKPIHHWNRYWQDRAFWTAFRFGAGKKHWYFQGTKSCDRLA